MTRWPGFNPHVDGKIGAKRIAFGQSYNNHPRYAPDNVTKPDIACGSNVVPALAIAPARAGSNITFGWSTWPITHNGPIMTYMAKYEGNLKDVNVNQLEFFKIAEMGLAEDGVTWATNALTANENVTAATIPHDIKSGNYVVRHELITLHFATEDSRYYDSASKTKGAQVRNFKLEILNLVCCRNRN
jgi:ethanolamine utilization protein EutA (predicted chaperonin)